jgi:hypothetical protein
MDMGGNGHLGAFMGTHRDHLYLLVLKPFQGYTIFIDGTQTNYPKYFNL